ncbi:hypothetical protein AVEN_96919-1 [Araneus ventricosus]|uniref:Uncharacterized protein n=1 Tax=Araneus ventricosus TaxID=182803 RepID=A0A4Y2C4Q0_ARAVE|nr:hypothetical protein AVEN_96919-1 [Araneus ventricosus]
MMVCLDVYQSDEYKKVLKAYICVREGVVAADKSLSFPLFMVCLFNAVMMYIAVTSLMHTEDYEGALDLTAVWITFIISYTSFAFMTYNASLIQETNEEIGYKARKMIACLQNPTTFQLSFLLMAEQKLSMKVWKISSMESSFFFSQFGTVLTYSILFDNLRLLKKNH